VPNDLNGEFSARLVYNTKALEVRSPETKFTSGK
jgi:hypothetical protein